MTHFCKSSMQINDFCQMFIFVKKSQFFCFKHTILHCIFRIDTPDKKDDGVWLQSHRNDFKSSSILNTIVENRVLGHLTLLWVHYSKTLAGSDLCSFISWRHQRLMTTKAERNEYTPLKLDSGILNGLFYVPKVARFIE